MWLFDMTRELNEKMKRKMLRESILSCFSHLICLNYIPTAIYKQLMYWLDDEVIKDGEIVEKTTYLMDLIAKQNTLNTQDSEEWDTEPIRIGPRPQARGGRERGPRPQARGGRERRPRPHARGGRERRPRPQARGGRER